MLKGRLPRLESELARAKARLEKPFESEEARIAYQQVVDNLEHKVDALRQEIARAEARIEQLQSENPKRQPDKQ